jgi:hypothetical protein
MKKSIIFGFCIPLCISLFLICVWFSKGLLIATGEGGLVFYPLTSIITFVSHTWSPGAIGLPTGSVLASYPFYFLFSALDVLHVAPYLMQAILFLFLLVIAQVGIFLLLRLIVSESGVFKKEPWYFYLSSYLFYICNPISIATVWNRFQSPFIIFYCLLPLLTYVYVYGLFRKRVDFILYFNALALCASLSLSSIPMLEMLWGVLFLFSAYVVLSRPFSLKSLLFVVGYFIANILVWIGFNLWWIAPFIITLRNTMYITTEAYSESGNIATFMQLSSMLGNPAYVLRLMHGTFFKNMSSVWGDFYISTIGIAVSMLIPIVGFLPLVFRRIPLFVSFFMISSLVILFFISGSHGPLGFVLLFLFSHVRFLEVFRNSFEKLSLIVPIFFSPLIGYSLYRLRERRYVSYFLLFLICGVFSFPLWNGWVFSGTFVPTNNLKVGTYVAVPDDYAKIASLVDGESTQFRGIAFPFNGEGMTHTWRYGYSGVDLYNGLFRMPFISFSTSIQFYKPIADALQPLFFEHPQAFVDAAGLLNAKYLVIRDDVDFKTRDMVDPQIFLNRIATNSAGLREVAQSGALHLFEVAPERVAPKVYAGNTFTTYPDIEPSLYKNILPYSLYQKERLYVREGDLPEGSSYAVSEVFYTAKEVRQKRFFTPEDRFAPIRKFEVSPENVLNELPYVKYSPTSNLYWGVRLKEQIYDFMERGEWKDEQFRVLMRGSKRLSEIYGLVNSGQDAKIVSRIADDYVAQMKRIDEAYIFESTGTQQELARHRLVLNMILKKYSPSSLAGYKEYLDSLLTDGIEIRNGSQYSSIARTFEMDVPHEGSYIISISGLLGQDTLYVDGVGYSLDSAHSTVTVMMKRGKNVLRFDSDTDHGRYREEFNDYSVRARTVLGDVKNISVPSITFQQRSSAQYSISVKNASEPFYLVFSEGFHPLWKLSQNGQVLDVPHFLVNGYANAWKISEKGDFSLELEFGAERFFSWGYTISRWCIIVVSFLGIGVLVFRIFRRKTR